MSAQENKEYSFIIGDNKDKSIYFIFRRGQVRFREDNNMISSTDITHVNITEDWLNILLASHLNPGSYLSSGLKIQYGGKIVAYTFVEFRKYYDFCKSLTPIPPPPEPKELTMEAKINLQVNTMKGIESRLQEFFLKPCDYPLGSKNAEIAEKLKNVILIFEKIGSLYCWNINIRSCRANCLISGISILEVFQRFYNLESISVQFIEFKVVDVTIGNFPMMDFIRANSAYIIHCAEKQPTDEEISKRARLIYQNLLQK